jgi:hypothetical protein
MVSLLLHNANIDRGLLATLLSQNAVNLADCKFSYIFRFVSRPSIKFTHHKNQLVDLFFHREFLLKVCISPEFLTPGAILCLLPLDLGVLQPNVIVSNTPIDKQEDSMTPSSRQNRPDAGWKFDNSYARLPEAFYVQLNPVPVRTPKLVVFNGALAQFLGLKPDTLKGDAVFSGNKIPEGAEPLAQAYAEHQFGSFTMLGDGRAILLGEQVTPKGERFDIQYKGSGKNGNPIPGRHPAGL